MTSVMENAAPTERFKRGWMGETMAVGIVTLS
jgi:hypothetical protein